MAGGISFIPRLHSAVILLVTICHCLKLESAVTKDNHSKVIEYRGGINISLYYNIPQIPEPANTSFHSAADNLRLRI
jgi:hypothetical protein